MLFVRKIQIYYRRNLEEYRWLLIGNLVAFLLLLLSIAFPAWTVRQNSDSTMEYYGVIWSLSRSNISFNVYKIHSMCDGTMDDLSICDGNEGRYRVYTKADRVKLLLLTLVTTVHVGLLFIPFQFRLRINGSPWTFGTRACITLYHTAISTAMFYIYLSFEGQFINSGRTFDKFFELGLSFYIFICYIICMICNLLVLFCQKENSEPFSSGASASRMYRFSLPSNILMQ